MPYGKVVMTIETPKQPFTDTTSEGRLLNLKYRCDIANKVKGKSIFISLHANAFSDPSASGYEIFVTSKSSERYEIAKAIHQASKDILGVGISIKDRGIKEAAYHVLVNTNMPAILIEHEFYTNLTASNKLKDNEFKNKCAEHIKVGLLNYLKEV